MKKAHKVSDIKEWAAHQAERAKAHKASVQMAAKIFEDLSQQEKDKLLKMVFVRMGFISPSADLE